MHVARSAADAYALAMTASIEPATRRFVDANGRGPISNGDGNGATHRPQIADLVRRLRHAADQLPIDRTAHDDLKILSQTLRELRHAFTVFAPYRSQRKVTIFGSARTPRDAPAYQQAVQLGKRMAENGWFVVTGAATGIMEAGHRGAGRDRSMGLNIMLPFEQEANEIIRGDPKLVTMKYFFTRKLMFVKECDAVVCLPGGFGTLDEAFEVLTLLQTGKREMMPLVFLDAPGGTYLAGLAGVHSQATCWPSGMISPEDLSLFQRDRQRGRDGRRDPAVLPRVPQHGVRPRPARAAAAQSRSTNARLAMLQRDSPTSSPTAISGRKRYRWRVAAT